MITLKYPQSVGAVLLHAVIALPALGMAAGVEAAAAARIEPFTGAEVAFESTSERSRVHTVPVDRFARVDGFMQPRTTREVEGRARSVTWRHPRGVTTDAVFRHLRAQLPADAWYECRSRDCGASTHWAHRQFEVSALHGADDSQFYVAVPRATPEGPVLTMLYVVQRGTREVMAHFVDILLEPGALSTTDPDALVSALLDTGVARLPVEFDAADAPNADFDRLLEAITEASGRLPDDAELWFVVHLRDDGLGSDATLEASRRRAEQLAERLQEQLPERTISGLGVGALIPGVLRDEGALVQLVVQQPPS